MPFPPSCLSHAPPLPSLPPRTHTQFHLHFVPGNATSLTLRWSADAPGCTPRLTYGRVSDGDDDDVGLTVATASTPYAQTSYTAADMCASPANEAEFEPPSLYGAVLEGLTPGADHWFAFDEFGGAASHPVSHNPSTITTFRVPPAPSRHARLALVAFGDMGEPEHARHKCAGAATVAAAVAADVAAGRVDALLHIGDIAYADGVPGAWDRYEAEIEAAASAVPLAVAAGNHEAADGAGECCVPYAARYGEVTGWRTALAVAGNGSAPVGPQAGGAAAAAASSSASSLPPAAQPPFWYGFNAGPVVITVLSTEHGFDPGTPQHAWAAARLRGIDRCTTPWSLLALHRPLYVPFPHKANRAFGALLRAALEPLLLETGVDAVLAGHVHCYARSCPVAAKVCVGSDDDNDDDRASSSSSPSLTSIPNPPTGATHWTLGTGGRKLSGVDGLHKQPHWVESALAEWGFLRVTADGAATLAAEFVGAETGSVLDAVQLVGGERQACRESGVSVA